MGPRMWEGGRGISPSQANVCEEGGPLCSRFEITTLAQHIFEPLGFSVLSIFIIKIIHLTYEVNEIKQFLNEQSKIWHQSYSWCIQTVSLKKCVCAYHCLIQLFETTYRTDV